MQTQTERLARTFQETAPALGVHKDTLRRAWQRGELKAIRVGGRLLIPESEVQRIVREGLGKGRTQGGRR